MKPQVYVAGALTNATDLEQTRQVYERLGEYFEHKGWVAYVPHKHSDPVLHPDLSAHEVKSNNERQIALSCLMVAEVTDPSHGVGGEIDFAEDLGVPVILLYRMAKRRLSRQMKGRRNIHVEISYEPENLNSLFRELDDTVDEISDPALLFLWRVEGFKRALVTMHYIIAWSIVILVQWARAILLGKQAMRPVLGL